MTFVSAIAQDGAVSVTLNPPTCAWTGTPGNSASTAVLGSVTRTNLLGNPSPKAGSTTDYSAPAGDTLTSTTHAGHPAIQVADPSGGHGLYAVIYKGGGGYFSADAGDFAVGDIVRWSAYVMTSDAGVAASMRQRILTTGGAAVTTADVITAIQPGALTRVSAETTVTAAPAGSSLVVVLGAAVVPAAPAALLIRNTILEIGPAPLPPENYYFDGDTAVTALTRTDAYGTAPVAGAVLPATSAQTVVDRACSVEGTTVTYGATSDGLYYSTTVQVPGAWASTDATMLGPLPPVTPSSSQDGDAVLWPLGRTDPVGVKRPLRKRTGTIDYLCPDDAQAAAVRALYSEGADVTLRSGADSITHRPIRVAQRFEQRMSSGPAWRVSVDYYEVAS